MQGIRVNCNVINDALFDIDAEVEQAKSKFVFDLNRKWFVETQIPLPVHLPAGTLLDERNCIHLVFGHCFALQVSLVVLVVLIHEGVNEGVSSDAGIDFLEVHDPALDTVDALAFEFGFAGRQYLVQLLELHVNKHGAVVQHAEVGILPLGTAGHFEVQIVFGLHKIIPT
eukprot:CAMPEP_0116937878 /NCGR_PEP_ID=MMETSP0467-20121206/31765_1 /TAXON_ID=283647 /ORGANISM="Mesodinium pulex, Strain SPMC105" /LENGTH=169 /DNA_ID=CAMNT_0004619775 /DNA_START=148 /DNA_END=657 /DNA_ORIENTATION=+